jgi:hypothetical protein
MRILVISVILFVCASCMSGVIPCPEPKSTRISKSKLHKRSLESSPSFSARAEEDQQGQNKIPKSDIRTISNVSVEEWDCPRPGKKKYLPKEVKHNIRKNMQKIKSKEGEEKSMESAPAETIH